MNENMKEKKMSLLTVVEFSKLLNVHPNTVRNAIRYGRIQAIRIGTGKRSSYRISETELERMYMFDASQLIENIISERTK